MDPAKFLEAVRDIKIRVSPVPTILRDQRGALSVALELLTIGTTLMHKHWRPEELKITLESESC